MKRWYYSKTLWINFMAAALMGVEVNFGWMQPHMPVDFYEIMALALPVINLLLRGITKTGLSR